MTSVADMIQLGLVNIGDMVRFTFKGHTFTATICKGGIFSKCTFRRKGQNDFEPIFSTTTSFGSLTAWTEACLQDILQEYFTRFSSWKRTLHVASQQTMGDLRDRCKLTESTLSSECVTEIYRELQRLYTVNQEMAQYIKRMNKEMKRTWDVLPRGSIHSSLRPPTPKKRRMNDKEAFERIQQIIIENSILIS